MAASSEKTTLRCLVFFSRLLCSARVKSSLRRGFVGKVPELGLLFACLVWLGAMMSLSKKATRAVSAECVDRL